MYLAGSSCVPLPIKTESLIGRGTQEDPARYIYQYWDFKGNLLASHDTLNNAID